MAVTIKGTGVVWGADGFSAKTEYAVAGASTQSTTYTGIPSSITYTRDSQKFDLLDENGETVGQIFYNLKKTLSVTVTPTGSTISSAQSRLSDWMQAAGQQITIADSEGNTADNYNLISAVENRAQDGATTVDLVMEAFDANEVTTEIASS